MLVNVLMVIVGLFGLFFGGEWLVRGSSNLARSMGISPLIIGLTVVAFGTSAPELLVSLNAAFTGSSAISIGNIVGSNIANIGLILGVTGLIFPINVHIGLVRREIPIMIGVTLLTYVLIFNGTVERAEGLLLLTAFLAFNLLMYYITVRDRQSGTLTDTDLEEGDGDPRGIQRRRELGILLIGLLLLVAGARLTVDGAVAIARTVGISELVIGMTLVAIGTSLPELATSVIAALRKQNDIAIGNVVGSNIFNLLLVLGATAVIKPIAVDQQVINVDMLIALVFAILLLPFVRNQLVARWEAGLMLTSYIGFMVLLFVR